MVRKKSEAEVKKQLKRLLKEIEPRKEQAQKQGRGFFSLNEEQLIRKLRGETSNSPFFTAFEWDTFTTAGSRSYLLANYFNPDPQTYVVFTTLFFGLADLNPDINSAIAARDTRWPYVSTELVVLSSNEIGIAEFEFTVPYAPKGTYFINTVLWQSRVFEGHEGVGTLFDQGGSFWLAIQ